MPLYTNFSITIRTKKKKEKKKKEMPYRPYQTRAPIVC